MANARRQGDQHADGCLRARGAAGLRGDHDEGPVPVALRVTLFHAADCHLCTRALEVVRDTQAEVGFELELVDIGGDPELEARYREHLPVLEIEGERAFTYFVDADALRARLSG